MSVFCPLAPLLALFLQSAEPSGLLLHTEQLAEDERLLHSVRLTTDGAALVHFFRTLTVREVDNGRVERLVRQLGDPSYNVREQATSALQAEGPAILSALRQHLTTVELEPLRRGQHCIQILEGRSAKEVVAAAVRQMSRRRPPGAIELLLGLLPNAREEMIEEELLQALHRLTAADGTLEPSFLKALDDKEPSRRAAAALVVGRYGAAKERERVHGLLSDSSLTVRLRAVQGLAAAGDKSGIPALFPLMREARLDLAQQAEELLCLIAGADSPTITLEENLQVRIRCQNAWEAWWQKHGPQIAIARLSLSQLLETHNHRAQSAARSFLDAALSKDMAKLQRTVQLPFHLLDKTFQTFQEFEEAIKNMGDEQEFKFTITEVGGVGAYRKIAGNHSSKILAGTKPRDVRVVTVNLQNGEARLTVAVLVRVNTPRPRIFALDMIGFGGVPW